MMGPDAAMAGAALADMARRWANSNTGNNGFGQNTENAPQLPLLIDLLENENQYLLTADVPGLQKSDLKVCFAQSAHVDLFTKYEPGFLSMLKEIDMSGSCGCHFWVVFDFRPRFCMQFCQVLQDYCMFALLSDESLLIAD